MIEVRCLDTPSCPVAKANRQRSAEEVECEERMIYYEKDSSLYTASLCRLGRLCRLGCLSLSLKLIPIEY